MLKKNNQFYKLFTSCSDNYFLRKNNFRPQTKYYILICAGPTLGIFLFCFLHVFVIVCTIFSWNLDYKWQKEYVYFCGWGILRKKWLTVKNPHCKKVLQKTALVKPILRYDFKSSFIASCNLWTMWEIAPNIRFPRAQIGAQQQILCDLALEGMNILSPVCPQETAARNAPWNIFLWKQSWAPMFTF
jgi:hypothetical protein